MIGQSAENVVREMVVVVTIAALLIGCGTEPDDSGENTNGATLEFVIQPPSTVSAGEVFTVELKIHPGDGVERGEHRIGLTLDDHLFAEDQEVIFVETDQEGLGRVDLNVTAAASNLQLTASLNKQGEEELSILSERFSVVAAAAEPERSSISGVDGVIDETTAIEVELFDRFGNPAVGVVPVFQASGAGNHYGECSPVDDQGASRCSLTSSVAEKKTLELVEPVELAGASLYIFVVPCDLDGVPFGGGSGEVDDPYRICAPEQLNRIGTETEYVESAFSLALSLDMSDISQVNMIGSEERPFEGKFEGNNQSISNLNLDYENTWYVGLFGYTGEAAEIRSLELKDAFARGSNYVGALVGENHGLIVNVHASADVSSWSFAGGLVGANFYGAVEQSSSSGTVRVRGMAGGGLVGGNYSRIEASFSSADVLPNDTAEFRLAGGLVGGNEGEIVDCYAIGNVVGGERNIGGLVGMTWTSIRNSYSTGSAEASDYNYGGVVGFSMTSNLVTGSYWDTETSGIQESLVGEPLNTEEFGNQENFVEWDFENVWTMGTAPDGVVRPILRWQVQ